MKTKSNTSYKAGRKPLGFSVAQDGTIILDSAIKSIIEDYRSQEEFQNAG